MVMGSVGMVRAASVIGVAPGVASSELDNHSGHYPTLLYRHLQPTMTMEVHIHQDHLFLHLHANFPKLHIHYDEAIESLSHL